MNHAFQVRISWYCDSGRGCKYVGEGGDYASCLMDQMTMGDTISNSEENSCL
jgi:hypothetical protein